MGGRYIVETLRNGEGKHDGTDHARVIQHSRTDGLDAALKEAEHKSGEDKPGDKTIVVDSRG